MRMLHEVMAGAGLAFWAEAALLLFFAAFAAVLVWVYGVRRAEDFEPMASLPLDEDDLRAPEEAPVSKERA